MYTTVLKWHVIKKQNRTLQDAVSQIPKPSEDKRCHGTSLATEVPQNVNSGVLENRKPHRST